LRQVLRNETTRAFQGWRPARIAGPPPRRVPKPVAGSVRMLNASRLSIIEEAGVAVLILTEGLEKDEFLASRLTRAETRRQITTISESAANLAPHTQGILAEVDWAGWDTVARQLDADPGEAQDALWFAVRALVPATLMWLRVYRKERPDIFECKPLADVGGATP
jgi:uncharacterized protein with HEPN domain